ncbi:flavin monoamine oxidase family protein [Pseudomonas sp. GCM10022188]|uniref:flavin monoamine oxidase family protein n=1 Tax=Pseudomonas TaxID=286 RepID=UPI001E596BA4|nr:FAD-dependent oxidoreductase [Pseudomonas oryzagri]MCC6075915.1 FAD-dependent oxidoreductase [Pseudomonas oryzagri]
MTLQTAEVVVVGAGLSGLSAAWRLAWAGKDVHVLEAGGRLGGRILTRAFSTGTPVELGAAGIGARQRRLRQLVGELGLALQAPADAPVGFDRLYAQALGEQGWLARQQLRYLWRQLEQQAARLPPQPAAEHALARTRDALSLAAWLDRRWLGGAVRQLAGQMAECLFAAPQEQSLLQAQLQLRRHGGGAGLLELRLGCVARPAGGMQTICQALVQRLGDALHLDTPLLAVEQDGQSVELLTAHGRWRAGRVVLALPVLMLTRLGFAPALPGWHEHVLRHLLPQASVDAQLRYERPFWRERLPYVDLPRSVGDCLVVEQAPQRAGEGALRVRLSGELARRCQPLSAPARQALLLDTLGRGLGEPARSPLECLLQCWSDEPFLRCAAPFWPAGGWSVQAPQLVRPLGRVHFAGADLALRWPGTLEGAVEAGERAADEVLALG